MRGDKTGCFMTSCRLRPCQRRTSEKRTERNKPADLTMTWPAEAQATWKGSV